MPRRFIVFEKNRYASLPFSLVGPYTLFALRLTVSYDNSPGSRDWPSVSGGRRDWSVRAFISFTHLVYKIPRLRRAASKYSPAVVSPVCLTQWRIQKFRKRRGSGGRSAMYHPRRHVSQMHTMNYTRVLCLLFAMVCCCGRWTTYEL